MKKKKDRKKKENRKITGHMKKQGNMAQSMEQKEILRKQPKEREI